MTQKENQQLLDLLRKKEAEIKMATEYVAEHCDDREQENFETQDLRKMRRYTQYLINEMTADFGAQETIDHVNDEIRELSLEASDAPEENPLQATIGKKLHNYDSWNGSSMTITIETYEVEPSGVRFIGSNAWGNKSGIFVADDEMNELLTTGHAEQERELEGCTTKETWDLKEA